MEKEKALDAIDEVNEIAETPQAEREVSTEPVIMESPDLYDSIISEPEEPAEEKTAIDTDREGSLPSNTAEDAADNSCASDSAKEAAVEPEEAKKKRRRRRKKIYEYTPDNDIKFRGPLSYRTLRVLAWFFLFVSQVGVILALGAKFDSGLANKVGELPTYLKMASEIMMPLFLIATFATILNGSRTFKSMLIFYGGGAVLFYLLFILFHERYIPIILGWVMDIPREDAVIMIDFVLTLIIKDGYLAFNIFIDLFLCTLLFFFLIYKPKKIFTGKKLMFFRLFAAIPLLCEAASFTVKMLGALGKLTVSPYVYPILTAKPPMTFFVFVAILIFIKVREYIFRKHGKTHEEYQQFLKTKANSWQFSRFTARIMAIAGILDLIIYFILSIFVAANGLDVATATEETIQTSFTIAMQAMTKVGIGGSGALLLASPLVLFFSYTRTHKKSSFDLLLPIFAIIALIFLYLESAVIATKLIGPFADFIRTIMHR